MKFIGIIPARYASTRFPGKPLAMLGGKYVIERVYNMVAETLDDAYVATDDQRIYDAVVAFGGKAVMTREDHKSGTDRIEEAVEKLGSDCDVVVNIQGDEPFIHKSQIETVCRCFTGDSELQMATLKVAMNEEDYNNPAAVKVVTDLNGYALYFSRSLMPYPRNKPEGYKVYKHVGIYAYRRSFLLKYAALQPTPLERAESLEQLRALENGYKIKVLESDFQGIGVDTPEDLAAVNELFAKMNK